MKNFALEAKVSILAMAATLGACTQATYVKSIESFATGTKTATQIAADEAKLAIQTHRSLGVLCYVEDPKCDKKLNIDPSEPEQSFQRFVCAGKGVYEKQLSSLEELNQYADVLSRLAQTPKDKEGVLARASTIKSLLQPIPNIQTAPTSRGNGKEDELNKQYEECINKVSRLLPLKGRTLVPAPEEIAPALLAIPAIYKAAQDALDKAGSIVESWARAAAINNYVENNKAAVNANLTDLQSNDWLGKAYEDRKSVAIAEPFLRFRALLKMPLKTDTDKLAVLQEGGSINKALAQYDELRSVEPGILAMKSAQLAQADLERLVSGKLNADETWRIFRDFVENMKSLADAVSDSNKKSKEATSGK